MRIRKRLQLYLGLNRFYGQREEDRIIARYFGDFTGTLLSIGENDGLIYSNALYFIKRGWKADLVEPSPTAFRRLTKRHIDNRNVHCHPIAISNATGKMPFWESGELVDLGDTALVSSLHVANLSHWPMTNFWKTEVRALTFPDFMDQRAHYQRCLVVEHGGEIGPFNRLLCAAGYRLLVTTEENFIFIQ